MLLSVVIVMSDACHANPWLSYAFASHFAPAMLKEALSIYRTIFQPSDSLSKPYVMIAAGVCAAETDGEAEFLRLSQLLAFSNSLTGKPGKLPYPINDVVAPIPAPVFAQVKQAMSCSATVSAATIKAQLRTITDTYRPDELIVSAMFHNHTARVCSFEIVATVLTELRASTEVP